MLPNPDIIFSGIVNRQLRILPAYFMLIAANVLPVYGAAIGKLVFFQVLYLYWFESLLLILFDFIRILSARGSEVGESMSYVKVLRSTSEDGYVRGFWRKLGMALSTAVVRALLLLFYLVFLILFIGFHVTAKGHEMHVMETIVFQDQFFNTSVIAFIINMLVQLIGVFFIGGQYRKYSPRTYTSFMDVRTIIIHVMLAGSVFIHQFFFEGKSYEATGEIVYIGLFMLAKTGVDLLQLRGELSARPAVMPMI